MWLCDSVFLSLCDFLAVCVTHGVRTNRVLCVVYKRRVFCVNVECQHGRYAQCVLCLCAICLSCSAHGVCVARMWACVLSCVCVLFVFSSMFHTHDVRASGVYMCVVCMHRVLC